jgi:hypothetical protein
MDDEELRELLRSTIQHRLRERGEAWERLDDTLEKRENGGRRVAPAGDGPETPPGHHRQRI